MVQRDTEGISTSTCPDGIDHWSCLGTGLGRLAAERLNAVPSVSSRSFRRTQLTELYRDGWSLREIQHISGHRSLQSLQEYLDIDKEKVVDKFRQRMEVVS